MGEVDDVGEANDVDRDDDLGRDDELELEEEEAAEELEFPFPRVDVVERELNLLSSETRVIKRLELDDDMVSFKEKYHSRM